MELFKTIKYCKVDLQINNTVDTVSYFSIHHTDFSSSSKSGGIDFLIK